MQLLAMGIGLFKSLLVVAHTPWLPGAVNRAQLTICVMGDIEATRRKISPMPEL
jgi:hypothetical protein